MAICSNLHMQTLYPIKIKAGNKFKYGFYLWSETWKKTDDFFYVWQREGFKPYYRNKTYAYQNGQWVEVYPEYHYTDEFETALKQFIDSLPIKPVVVQGKRVFFLYGFEDDGYTEYWSFDPYEHQVYYTYTIPRDSEKPEKDLTLVKESLYEFVMKYVKERVKFADIHLNHLITVMRGYK